MEKNANGIKFGENNLYLDFNDPSQSYTKGGNDAFALYSDEDLCGHSNNWPNHIIRVYQVIENQNLDECVSSLPFPTSVFDNGYQNLKNEILDFKFKLKDNFKPKIGLVGLPNSGNICFVVS